MSAFIVLREPLGRALKAARRIAESSVALLNSPGSFRDEVRCLRRDLPHLNKQAVSAFCGDERLTADLQHELNCVEEDAFALADWVIKTSDELERLFETANADSAVKYGQERTRAFSQIGEYKRRVQDACNRAFTTANRLCIETDKAQKVLGTKVRAVPVPPTATQTPPTQPPASPASTSSSLAPAPSPVTPLPPASPPLPALPAGPLSEDQFIPAVESTAKPTRADPVLSERQYDALEAMLDLKATDPARRKTTEEIAKAAEGGEAKPEWFKEPIAGMVKLGLVATKTGRGGGCWLTETGRNLADQIRKR